jgi:hypothetical protein
MSEMCINSIFQRFFPILLAKKNCPVYYNFCTDCLSMRFPYPGQILLKKNTHIPLFGHAQKNAYLVAGWSVGRFPCMFVCWSDFYWSFWLVFFCILFS